MIHHEAWYREAGEREQEHLRALILRRDFSVLPEYLKEIERTHAQGYRKRAVDYTIAFLGDHLQYPDPSESPEVRALYEEFLTDHPPDHLDWQANPEKNRRKAAVFQRTFPEVKGKLSEVMQAAQGLRGLWLRSRDPSLREQMQAMEKTFGKAILAYESGTALLYDGAGDVSFSGWMDLKSTQSFLKSADEWLNETLPRLHAEYSRTASLTHTEVDTPDITFKTGTPVEFLFSRNLETAPDMGSTYQQDIEPAGMYVVGPVSLKTQQHFAENLPGKYLMGTIRFQNPLVIPFNSQGVMSYDEHSWKAMLSEHYGATGRELANKVRADGYDGIVTVHRGDTSEIVCLDPSCVTKG